MKYTLLEIVQAVLSSIDGDEVNSITDTTESQQVAQIIKRVYGNLAPKLNFPEQKTLFGLTPSNDIDKPTLMYLPTGQVRSLEWLKYDCRTADDGTDAKFQFVEYVPLTEFLQRMHSLVPSADSTLGSFDHSVNGQTVEFIYRTDVGPSYYTTWDDRTLVFDAYDSGVDSTLQSSKTLGYGEAVLSWSMTDNYIIPIDDHQLLLNESIAWAWAELKQAQNAKAEREARNQLIAVSRDKQAVTAAQNYQIQLPNYGRK